MTTEFKYQVGDVVRFTSRGYNDQQRIGMTAIVRAVTSRGVIVDSDDEGETMGWKESVEFVSRPSDAPYPSERTLRDEFAMAAMTGVVSRGPIDGRRAARIAYEFADAMMEARK